MQYSNNIITRLIEYINEDDNLSSLGIAIRAFDTRGLPVPINETYFSFSCKENSVVFEKNEDGTVTSLISREEYYARHSEQYVEETFGGSLPAFLAAFGTRKKLTDQEIDELQKVIDGMRR